MVPVLFVCFLLFSTRPFLCFSSVFVCLSLLPRPAFPLLAFLLCLLPRVAFVGALVGVWRSLCKPASPACLGRVEGLCIALHAWPSWEVEVAADAPPRPKYPHDPVTVTVTVTVTATVTVAILVLAVHRHTCATSPCTAVPPPLHRCTAPPCTAVLHPLHSRTAPWARGGRAHLLTRAPRSRSRVCCRNVRT